MEKEIKKINNDLYEMESLLNVAKRQRIKNFLSIELRRLTSEKQILEERFRNERTAESKKLLLSEEKTSQVKLDNYAWDQSPKYIKFLFTLPKIHQLDSENIKCQFNIDSFTLIVTNLDKKDFVFNSTKLLHPIVPEKSFWKVKSDYLVIFLVKSSTLKWPHLTKNDEEKAQEKKNKYEIKKSDNHDENSLFCFMKNMYEKGDDQLKRTIAQAWTESHASQ